VGFFVHIKIMNKLNPKNIIKVREATKTRSSRNQIVQIDLPDPQPGAQELFYDNYADVCIYGGAAGSGKSYAMLLKAAKYLNVPGYGSVIFRRTRPEITNEGGLWDESRSLYKQIKNSIAREYQLDWTFPNGSAISFGHAQYEKDVEDKYPGSQICHIGFDELTKFTERQFWFLFSRNRSACGVKPRIDATCNPDADSWVAKMISWYIDQNTGYPIEERSGIIRYFYRINGELHWGDTEDELMDKFPDLAEIAPPKSFSFIKGTVYDNPALIETNPQYLQNLLSLHPVEMERLLKGNWKIKYESGTIFNRQWFEIVNAVPSGGTTVAFWDFAATAADVATKSSFYSVRTKIKLHQGTYYILDCHWEQVSAEEGDLSVVKIAYQDGPDCKIRWELEGGSAGKRYEVSLKRQLAQFDAKGIKPLGDKVTRALPMAIAAKQGKVKLLRGAWNDQFLAAIHEFDGSKKPLTNDIVDSADGAFSELGNSAPRSTFVGGKINNPFA
jgi:predicted phage terminase large subunit-like protein